MSTPSETGTDQQPYRILLAEDNDLNQRVVLHMLDRLGLEADVAVNGQEVLEAIEREPYDIVLLDIRMPVMDGLEAARRIRTEIAPSRQPRLVALTAEAGPEAEARFLEAGLDDYLSKPLTLDALSEVLARLQPSSPTSSETSREGRNLLERVITMTGTDDPDFIKSIVEDYVDSTKVLIAAMEEARAAGDHASLERHVHTLKSSSHLLGADDLRDECQRLETALSEGREVSIPDRLEVIRGLYAEHERALKRSIESLP